MVSRHNPESEAENLPRESGSAYPIRSVDRVCDILDSLANSDAGLSLVGVAAATDLPKSSVFRYLSALEARYYVERSDSSTYDLGPAFRPRHTRSIDLLVQLARPRLEELRDRLGETTNLGVLDGTEILHSVVCESHQMVRLAARVGDRGTIHSTALGKAICATLPESRVQSILRAAGMPRLTGRTIVDQRAFLAELAQVREVGFGLDDAENQEDGLCVAVAIPGLSFSAGLSVSAPSSRLTRDDAPAVARQLREIAEHLTRQLE